MKYIYTNLKRFDIPVRLAGVNRLAPAGCWGAQIVERLQDEIERYSGKARFTFFFPEAHLITAANAKRLGSPLQIGCQGVCREDVAPGGNFGAFTTNRPAAAAKALGCGAVLIGHCEERADKAGILAEAGVSNEGAVNRILNQEIRAAVGRGLDVLYCIGERAEQQERWQEVLAGQLEIGLRGAGGGHIAIAYEPVWAIGPGKAAPDRDYIQRAARFVKEATGGLPVVYGGGLKEQNAAMLASIPEIDGGLIALTRFSGEIGFYPEEYLQIVRRYLGE